MSGMWALRNLLDGAVHVFSSCLVCFEELTFLLMFFPKWLHDKQSTLSFIWPISFLYYIGLVLVIA